MRYRPNWGLVTIGALLVLVLFTFPAWRGFVNVRLGGQDFSDASESQRAALLQIRRTQGPNAAGTAYRSLLTIVPAPTKDRPTPDGGRFQPVKGGEFIELDAIHIARGRAVIYRNAADNSLLLRLDEFSVTNGPGLAVVLSEVAVPKTSAEVLSGQYFRVATLKATNGNQNYEIPPELRLERYKSVVIYSEDLKTIYSSAALF
jgi:hypothetical protein